MENTHRHPYNCQIIESIPVYSGGLEYILNELTSETINNSTLESHCISATGAHGIVTAYTDAQFKKTLTDFYLNFPDGMPLVWLAKLKGFSNATRCYGPDFFDGFLKRTAGKNVRHFFCGGKSGIASLLSEVMQKKYPGLQVSGYYCPPFSPMTEQDWQYLVRQIQESDSTVIWVGISTPKQEKFALELSKRVKVKYLVTIGAAFDFYTGQVPQAPKWMQQASLEWFYRLCKEPRRLAGRYSRIVPTFVYLAIINLFNHYLRKVDR
jgi:N-acetylglucosaminyldiphosphoundecaprenol N-acetyl-beta-D-mannosaminyltransferase